MKLILVDEEARNGDGTFGVKTENGEWVFCCEWGVYEGTGSVNNESIMRVMLAAPDLLETLRGLVTLCQEDESYHDPENEPDSYAALERAEAAIAKAEGGAQ